MSLSTPPSSESMILLGSIERTQLQALLSQQLGRPRRLEYLRQRAQNERKHVSVVSTPSSEEGNHKSSHEVRFQVSTGGQNSSFFTQCLLRHTQRGSEVIGQPGLVCSFFTASITWRRISAPRLLKD